MQLDSTTTPMSCLQWDKGSWVVAPSLLEIHYSLSLRELQIVVEIDEVCVPVAWEGNTGQSDLCANIFNVQYMPDDTQVCVSEP